LAASAVIQEPQTQSHQEPQSQMLADVD
jgi:hypothetical protein